MKPINDFENVKATSSQSNRPVPGGYCVEILKATDVTMNDNTGKGGYLKLEYDICVGDFAGFYTKQHERFGGAWFATFIRSYKDSAAGMFKHFINCVEESNPGFKWAWNEKSLENKYVGIVLREEEYRKNDGTIGTRLVVRDIKTTTQIVEGDFRVPALKKLAESSPAIERTQQLPLIDTSDLPF